MVDILLCSDAHESVTHLDVEVRRCNKFDTCADNPGYAYAVCAAEMKVLETLAGERGVGDHDTAGHEVMIPLNPVIMVHGYLLAEEDAQSVNLRLGCDNEDFIPLIKDGVSCRE